MPRWLPVLALALAACVLWPMPPLAACRLLAAAPDDAAGSSNTSSSSSSMQLTPTAAAAAAGAGRRSNDQPAIDNSQAGSQPPGSRPTSYKTLWDAVQHEMWVMQQLTQGHFATGDICVLCWATSPGFRPLFAVATDARARATVLSPTHAAYQRLAAAYCLTLPELLERVIHDPELPANFLRSSLIPGVAVPSSAFRDGLKLRSMPHTSSPGGTAPHVGNYTLSERTINGTTTFVLRNASIFKLAGSLYDYEDVPFDSSNMNVRAGAALLHSINSIIRLPSEDLTLLTTLKGSILRRAGLPPNSTTCPSRDASAQRTLSPAHTAGIAVGTVGGGVLLLAALLLLLLHHQAARRDEGACKQAGGVLSGCATKGGSTACSPTVAAGGGSTPRAMSLCCLLLPQTSWGNSTVTSGSGLSQQGSVGGKPPPSSSSGATTVCVQPSVAPLAAADFDSPFAGPFAGADLLSSIAECLQPQALNCSPSTSSVMPTPTQASLTSESSVAELGAAANCTIVRAGRGGPAAKQHGGWCYQGAHVQDRLPHTSSAGSTSSGSSLGALRLASDFVGGLGLELVPTASMALGSISRAFVIPNSELQLQELIGSGAEGKVYRGMWQHTEVAAKEFHAVEPAGVVPPQGGLRHPSDAALAHAQAALAKEVHWLTSLNHPNLVRFCAVCLDPPLVVMEYYRHGSVFALMQRAALELANKEVAPNTNTKYLEYLSWERRLEMLHDVAAGMSYLHGRDHIHGDLRSPNLFVGEVDGKVKIGDFGFTKRLAQHATQLKVSRVTHPRWASPELILDSTLSSASDVYSFGIVLYELLTLRIPFDALRKEQVVIEVIQGARPRLPTADQLPCSNTITGLDSYVRLMEQCWAQDPAQRPTFEAIARRLKAHIRWCILRSRHALTAKAARAATAAAGRRSSTTTTAGSGAGAPTGQQHQGDGKAAERLSGGLPRSSDDLSSAGLAMAGNAAIMPSLPISSAIVGGINLAAVALPAALPHDALSSVAAQAGVTEGRRVMLVGSDLPNTR